MAGKESRQKQERPTIQAVTPLDHHRLLIKFGSGSVLELNMKNRLRAARYYDLNNDGVFRSAVTDGEKIIFDTGTNFELELFARETVNLAMQPPDGAKSILRIGPLESGRLRLEMSSGSILTLNLEEPHTVGHPSPEICKALRSVSTDGETLIFGDAPPLNQEALIRLALTGLPLVEETFMNKSLKNGGG